MTVPFRFGTAGRAESLVLRLVLDDEFVTVEWLYDWLSRRAIDREKH